MIGDIASVLSLLNDLVTRKSEINREHFEDFIEPIWLAFTQIHEDYKEALPRYRDMLLKGENPIEILHQINFDSCLTEDLRVRLAESMRSISSKKSAAKEKLIYDFAGYILDYFDSTHQTNKTTCEEVNEIQQAQSNQVMEKSNEIIEGRGFKQQFNEFIYNIAHENIVNIGRVEVFNSIAGQLKDSETLSDQAVYKETMFVIQSTLERLQDCYRRVAESYFLVRKELLK